MSVQPNSPAESRVHQFAHVVGRVGLSMSGAICGTFVAAYMARDIDRFGTVGFIASMVLVGMVGFYLGIDMPGRDARRAGSILSVDAVELLSATGTFLASIAALVSVYAIVFDQTPQRAWEFMVGSWWLFGVIMQIGAGATARMRFARKAAG
jgi:hypothetical protein